MTSDLSVIAFAGANARNDAQIVPEESPELRLPQPALQHAQSSPLEDMLQGAAVQLWSDTQRLLEASAGMSAGSTASAPAAALATGEPSCIIKHL